MGLSGGLSLALYWGLRMIIAAEGTPSVEKNMASPTRADLGDNCDHEGTSSGSGNWRQYFHFSSPKEGDSAPEPSTARAPVREEAPNEGGHEATSQPTGVMEQAGPSQIAPPGASSTGLGPAEQQASLSSSWKEDSFGIRVLLESWSKTTKTEGTSVNQPEAGPVPPGNPVASGGEEAGPANQTLRAVPYPYQPDEVIGGDSVLSIERRLLAKHSFPSSGVIEMARIQAEDLFEVKVEIIQIMAGLDPTGDWMGRGARALDNSRTATGEESLERLYALSDDLKRGGVQSPTYSRLKGKVLLRMDPDEHSSA